MLRRIEARFRCAFDARAWGRIMRIRVGIVSRISFVGSMLRTFVGARADERSRWIAIKIGIPKKDGTCPSPQ